MAALSMPLNGCRAYVESDSDAQHIAQWLLYNMESDGGAQHAARWLPRIRRERQRRSAYSPQLPCTYGVSE